jgi:anti-sigma factor RsiW
MNERIDDLIALAALGELTDDESRELDHAVQSDPEVAAELAAALEAAAAVQSTVAEDPPPRLKASVLDAIAGLPQQAPGGPDALGGAAPTGGAPAPAAPVATEAAAASSPTGGAAEATEPLPAVRSIGSARSRRGIVPWLAAAAAAIVVLVGAVVLLSAVDDPGVGDEIAEVVEADDAVARSLSGEIGELEVVYSAERDALVLTGEGIGAHPGLHLPGLAGGRRCPGLGRHLRPDPDGAIALRANGFDPTGAVVAVTVEPLGGSEQPTMPIVAQTT